jgi:NADH:ubiquinone oxidoreductase subunit 5 (subunit L)/multisubunit Na+/H+ antiporter MnhA subunit
VAAITVILLVISLILSGIILLPFAGSFFKTLFNPEETSAALEMTKNPLFIILSALVNAITIPVMPIFAAILYFNGKAKEDKKETEYMPANGETRVRVEDLYAKPYSDDHPDNPDKTVPSS